MEESPFKTLGSPLFVYVSCSLPAKKTNLNTCLFFFDVKKQEPDGFFGEMMEDVFSIQGTLERMG